MCLQVYCMTLTLREELRGGEWKYGSNEKQEVINM